MAFRRMRIWVRVQLRRRLCHRFRAVSIPRQLLQLVRQSRQREMLEEAKVEANRKAAVVQVWAMKALRVARAVKEELQVAKLGALAVREALQVAKLVALAVKEVMQAKLEGIQAKALIVDPMEADKKPLIQNRVGLTTELQEPKIMAT